MNGMLHVGETVQGQGAIGAVGQACRLPLEWVTSAEAIVGQRRSGKSTLAGVLEEEASKQGLHWGVIDPVSAHWGIRERYPAVIFGGPKADVPLRPHLGAEIARRVIAERFNWIVDLKGEPDTTKRRVVTDLALHLLTHNQEPMHVFLEEASLFVPQRIRPDQAVAFGAVDDMVRLGGGSGIGVTLISQRCSTINKDVLDQIDTLWAFRSPGPRDKKAIREWLEDSLRKRPDLDITHLVAGLEDLPDGRCWVWSPRLFRLLEQVQVRRRETFHAGATPKVGERREARLVTVDVGALRSYFEAIPDPAQKGAAPKRKDGATSAEAGRDAELAAAGEAKAQAEAAGRRARAADDRAAKAERAAAQARERAAQVERELAEMRAQGQAAAALRTALTDFLGVSTNGHAAPADREAIVRDVLARLPAVGSAIAVVAPEALRKEYQRREVERILDVARGLPPMQRDIVCLLEPYDGTLSTSALVVRLGRKVGGPTNAVVTRELKALEGHGFIRMIERHGARRSLREKIKQDLAFYGASEDEVEEVYQHVLTEIAREVVGAAG